MKKRDFLKIFSVGTVSAIALSSVAWSCMGADRKKGMKNWAWIHPVESSDPAHSWDAWKKLLTNLKKWGIDSALFTYSKQFNNWTGTADCQRMWYRASCLDHCTELAR